jgi:hypothetical protein
LIYLYKKLQSSTKRKKLMLTKLKTYDFPPSYFIHKKSLWGKSGTLYGIPATFKNGKVCTNK